MSHGITTPVIHISPNVHSELKVMAQARGLDLKDLAERLIRREIRRWRGTFAMSGSKNEGQSQCLKDSRESDMV